MPMLDSIHIATTAEAVAYGVLAVAAVAGTYVTVKNSKWTLSHQVTVHQETIRLDAYLEFLSALAKARSAGHKWHDAVRDMVGTDCCSRSGTFRSECREKVARTAALDVVHEPRNDFYRAVDDLWNAVSKVKLVGTPAVAAAADAIAVDYDPRLRELSQEVVEAFQLDPGFPLAGATTKRKEFMDFTAAQLRYLSDEHQIRELPR